MNYSISSFKTSWYLFDCHAFKCGTCYIGRWSVFDGIILSKSDIGTIEKGNGSLLLSSLVLEFLFSILMRRSEKDFLQIDMENGKFIRFFHFKFFHIHLLELFCLKHNSLEYHLRL